MRSIKLGNRGGFLDEFSYRDYLILGWALCLP